MRQKLQHTVKKSKVHNRRLGLLPSYVRACLRKYIHLASDMHETFQEESEESDNTDCLQGRKLGSRGERN